MSRDTTSKNRMIGSSGFVGIGYLQSSTQDASRPLSGNRATASDWFDPDVATANEGREGPCTQESLNQKAPRPCSSTSGLFPDRSESSMDVPYPINERERLQALRALKIVHTEPTPEFDLIAALAASIFNVPIGLVSFIESEFQWFKAKCGLQIGETCREVAFCSYTIMNNDALIVEDATKDERFTRNPMVTGDAHIRFYAGAPISLDGETNVATLCVIDVEPKKVSRTQIDQLSALAAVATALIRAHSDANIARTSAVNARQRGKLLSQMESISKMGAWSLDVEKCVTEWSAQVFAIHELPEDRPPSLIEAMSFYPKYERSRLKEAINECVENGTSFEIECDFITAKGNKRRVQSIGEIEHGENESKFLIGILKDITEENQQKEVLRRAAHFDSLTGVHNRFSFHDKISQMVNAGSADERGFSLLIIDLDEFKDVNDNLGHLAGDMVLRTVAQRIERLTSSNGFCARVGGDEFAVLLPANPDSRVAEEFANRLLKEIELPITYQEDKIRVGASIGIAMHASESGSEDEVLLNSDLALYHVKRNGRGKAQSFEPSINHGFEEKRHSIALIRSAVTEGRLEPFYQPIIDLGTLKMRGVEALVRVRGADGSIQGPADFWQALQDPQSARMIDEAMLRLSLKDFAQWRRVGLDLGFVSINASSICVHSMAYVDLLLETLRNEGLSPRDIKIEVVESVFMGNESHDVLAVLERLSAEGILIALDDFGTGYASLSHLRDFPVNCIKIDKSFVSGIGHDAHNTAIVQAMVGLGRSMKLQVIAEGIETKEQLDFVSSLGCDFGQGYFFSPPIAAPDLEKSAACKPPHAIPCKSLPAATTGRI
ncbi:EAL domain-containing protein [Hoeflea sp.]|uniref:putative bifunctional diguanylate cyclase/phosphodiesterase n=1 Tax=Hoeflea sp. TaxID=1940281 RepID=UPI0019C1E840|nr:EAL domain-containing protein [Hoeflea sp.]MBC7282970.1 EAL domain-containing protein [Hoeflea sp.]